MRAVIAMMSHETNTFSPVPTPLARFARGQASQLPSTGRAAYDAYRGTGSCMGAFIDLAEAQAWDIETPIAANAWPSGIVESAAYEEIAGHILEAVGRGCDALFLELHGAMVTENFEDGEGELLRRIRALAPDLPIATALDMHTNLYSGIIEHSTVVAGYQTYPHIDNYETGLRAGQALIRLIKGQLKPTMAWGNRPMIPHVMRQGSGNFPNRELQARARQMEAEGALIASLFTGFPHADVSNAGLSAVVVTDNDPALARQLCDELLDRAWRDREAFVYQIEPLETSLIRARQTTQGPVILLDHYDNAASGGTMDTMTVLAGIIETGLEDVAAFAIHDPRAVEQMIGAGIDAEISLALGGKIDMPSINKRGEPLEVRGRVKLISDGRYRNRGPASRGIWMDMGPSVVLDTGKVEIIVISRYQEPNDLGCLLSLGIDPRQKRFLMLKSRIHYRAGFQSLAREVIECAGTGVCTSDYGELDFKHLRRPVYPLDRINDPTPLSQEGLSA